MWKFDVGEPNLEVQAVVALTDLEERLAKPVPVRGSGETGVWVSAEVTLSSVLGRKEGAQEEVRWHDLVSGVGWIEPVYGPTYEPLPRHDVQGELVWLAPRTRIFAAVDGDELAAVESEPLPARVLGKQGEAWTVSVHTGGVRVVGVIASSDVQPAPVAQGEAPTKELGPIPLADTRFESQFYGCVPGQPCPGSAERLRPFAPPGKLPTWFDGPWMGFAEPQTGERPRKAQEGVVAMGSVLDAPDGEPIAMSAAQWQTRVWLLPGEGDWVEVVVDRPGAYIRGWMRRDWVMAGLPGVRGPIAWLAAGSALYGADGSEVGQVLRDMPAQVLACEKGRAKVWLNTAWGAMPLYVRPRALDRRCSAEAPW